MDRLLEVSGLRVSFATPRGLVQAVDGVSFMLSRGEVLAIVGESGSGKSVCAMSLIGLTRGPRTAIEGSALLGGQELIGASEAQLRAVRGAQMAMIFQDPQSSLNPVLRVGDQIAEQILAHQPTAGRARALERAAELMEQVEIPHARARVRSYPHELSGGMRQRVMIAMALSLGAKALLADEPTTALDVTVQAQILAQLKQLREQDEMGIVLITHDFGVVADIADRVAVMRAGQIVEEGSTGNVLRNPQHPYTRELLRALAPPAAPRPARAAGKPLVEVTDLRMSYGDILALDGVSLTVYEGETLAIVGESGCGKTTLIRAVARLIEPDGGTIRFAGEDVTRARRRKLGGLRGSLGMVFQDPQASLNPRRRVGTTIEKAPRARGLGRSRARELSLELIERVGLTPEHASRFPHELSGGERQRVGIARALAGKPRLVLLDEPVSSLDASLRRGVMELLAELQAQLGCSYVLVSHDLAMVAGVADRIAVMHAGKIVELGDAQAVLERPQHPYTRELLAARPRTLGGVGSGGWADNQSSPAHDGSLPARETSPGTQRGSFRS
jgi:peptide/nickel transport system ATP-binding protein